MSIALGPFDSDEDANANDDALAAELASTDAFVSEEFEEADAGDDADGSVDADEGDSFVRIVWSEARLPPPTLVAVVRDPDA